MQHRGTMKLITSICFLTLSSNTLSSASLRPVEVQFIESVKAGRLDRAKEIATLGNIDPMNLGGDSIDRYIFGYQGSGQSGFIKWPVLRYIFGELGISPNKKFGSENRSLLSLFCEQPIGYEGKPTTSEERLRDLDENVYQKFVYMISKGGSAKAFPNAAPHERGKQPLSACLYSIYGVQSPEIRLTLNRIIKLLLDNGADPSYDFDRAGGFNSYFRPAFVGALDYDRELMNTLVQYGERPTVTVNRGTGCGTSFAYNILNFLPRPNDKDIAKAKTFFLDYIEQGGDIKAPLKLDQCGKSTQTLKESALGAGQLAYARMVNELEQLPVRKADSKSLSSIVSSKPASNEPADVKIAHKWVVSVFANPTPVLGKDFVSYSLGPDASQERPWARKIVITCIDRTPSVAIFTVKKLAKAAVFIPSSESNDIKLETDAPNDQTVALTDRAAWRLIKIISDMDIAYQKSPKDRDYTISLTEDPMKIDTTVKVQGFRAAFRDALPKCKLP